MAHNVVPQNGPSDPGEALGVNDAKLNGIWLCPTCHGMLSKDNLLICPPLQILRAVRERFDPMKVTMQEFSKNIYAKEFSGLRSLYHLNQVRPNRFDRSHIWRFPCLMLENVMAVLLYMTGRPAPGNKMSLLGLQPPKSCLTLNNQFLALLFYLKLDITLKLVIEVEDSDSGSSETGDTDVFYRRGVWRVGGASGRKQARRRVSSLSFAYPMTSLCLASDSMSSGPEGACKAGSEPLELLNVRQRRVPPSSRNIHFAEIKGLMEMLTGMLNTVERIYVTGMAERRRIEDSHVTDESGPMTDRMTGFEVADELYEYIEDY
ncbi:hypothetical protein GGX14DRAFT_612011 [Mycena pura]|uniref:Uncharacterized protein n=1 Tax=Mycena pura TaxID=153505 RepID=A0AAD6YSJ1_9AGAR|nr:hypothetical protein GGX14DRAFT_612011 [Mycena pura]